MTQEMRSEIKQVKKQHVGAIWTEIPLVLSMYLQLTQKYLLGGGEALGRRGHAIPSLREEKSNIINGPITQQSQPQLLRAV